MSDVVLISVFQEFSHSSHFKKVIFRNLKSF